MTQPLLTPREHRVKAMLLRARNPNSRAAQLHEVAADIKDLQCAAIFGPLITHGGGGGGGGHGGGGGGVTLYVLLREARPTGATIPPVKICS